MQRDYDSDASDNGTTVTPKWSRSRIIVDILFGFLLPITCLVFDPFVFRSSLEPAFLGRYLPFAFAAMGISWASLILWMFLRRWGGILSGLMYAGGLYAFLLGFAVLPMAIFGLILLIGVLGFIPFATAYVFGRAAREAQRLAQRRIYSPTVVAGFLLAVAIPTLLQLHVSRVVDRCTVLMIEGDGFAVKTALDDLMWVDKWFGSHLLARKFIEHAEHRDQIASFYKEVAGQPIQEAFGPISDGPVFDAVYGNS